MNPGDFCVWLDGFLSVERSTKNLPKKDVELIKEKLEETKNRVVTVPTIFPTYIPPYIGDGILPVHDNPPWNPGYNTEPSDFAKITCESGPGGSG